MPVRTISRRFRLDQSYQTDLAAEVKDLTFLATAENVMFQAAGSVRKVGGSRYLHSIAVSGATDIIGMFDYWKWGTDGSANQSFVMVDSAGKFFEDTGAIPRDISGSVAVVAGSRPVFAQFQDTLTMWFNNGEPPRKYQQIVGDAVTLLGGTPPIARVAATHRNRLWAAATNDNPSRLSYSSYGAANIWPPSDDTGFIDVDAGDGDAIVGLASHKGVLIIFKGPYRGSIWQLTGSAPTGSDAFSLQPIVKGIALQTHNSIVPVLDDLWFMSERGIHSLKATQAYGDFAPSDITRYLNGFFRDQINRTYLDRVWGVHYPSRSCCLWTVTKTGGTENDTVLCLSYIRQAEEGIKASVWRRGCISAAIRVNPSNFDHDVVFGQTDGFAAVQDISTRALASTGSGGFKLGTDVLGTGILGDAFASTVAYQFRVVTPQIELAGVDANGQARADQAVALHRMYLRSEPLGDYNVVVALTRDENARELYTFNQGNAGFILDTDLLGLARLGGARLNTPSVELVGEARAITVDLIQAGAAQDAHLYELGLEFSLVSPSGESTLA